MRAPALAILSCAVGFSALADGRFGEPRQVVPLGSLQATYSSNGSLNQTVLGFSPGALFFVARDFAVGAQLDVLYQSESAPGSSTAVSATNFGLAPSAAFNLPVGDRFSLFPQASVRFGSSTPFAIVGGATSTQKRITGRLFAPVLVHLVPHFFLGAGPLFSLDFYASDLDTGGSPRSGSVGAQTVIGGWF